MNTRKRVLQANLNNQGGAFSVAYEAQKELQDGYIFDYFFPDRFVKNSVYEHLLSMGSKCVGEIKSSNRFLKQVTVYKNFYKYLCENNYDIVHIHSDTAWKISVYYLAAKKAHIKKIVVHSHSSGINGHHHKINYLIKNVLFAGAVTNVQDYLSAMDVFILPSRFEGLPMCALEAQVNGLYTIISDKVSEETKCSKHFGRLPLDAKVWEDKIKAIDFGYDRTDRGLFLDEDKASSSNMADEFKRIYSEDM